MFLRTLHRRDDDLDVDVVTRQDKVARLYDYLANST